MGGGNILLFWLLLQRYLFYAFMIFMRNMLELADQKHFAFSILPWASNLLYNSFLASTNRIATGTLLTLISWVFAFGIETWIYSKEMFSVCSWNAIKCVVCTEATPVAFSTTISKLQDQKTVRFISFSFGCIGNEKLYADLLCYFCIPCFYIT